MQPFARGVYSLGDSPIEAARMPDSSSSQSTTAPPLRLSLRAGVLDGTFQAAMVGLGETYFSAFALLLGSTPFQAGLIATVPVLAGSAFQLLSPLAASRLGEKRWVVGSAVLQAAAFLPVILLAGGGGGYAWLLSWVCVYWIAGLGLTPAWNAWMGRLVPARLRAPYFGRRAIPIQGSLLLSVVAGGLLIDASERSSWGAAAGFIASFALAACCRLASASFLARQYEPPADRRRPAMPIRTVLAGFRSRPYGRLITLLVLMSGAVNISAAYFTPFMLEGLQLSYAQFTILNGAAVAARALSSSYWGDIARSYGNRRALQVSAVLLVPLSGLWVFSSNFTYLLALQLFAGFAWAGFELTTILNFFDCTEEHNRARVLSVYNLLNGITIVTGTLLGGAMLRTMAAGNYFYLFLASSAVRALTVIFLTRGVGARRAREHSFQNVFVRVITLRPGQGPTLRPVVMGGARTRLHDRATHFRSRPRASSKGRGRGVF